MRTGLYISGAGHALLILWLLFGSLIGWRDDEVKLRVSDVSFISEEDFAALTAPRGEAAVPENPPAPEPAAPEEASAPPTRPEPDPTPEPAPEPEPEPIPEPPAPDPVVLDIPRVAPQPAPEPEPQIEVAPETVEAPAPAPEPEATPLPEVTPTAPEAATTEIVTEAKESEEEIAAAPTRSPRPPTRPERPETPAVTEPEETPEPADTAANAVANAVSDAIAGGQQDTPAQDIPEGPPLTRGEKEGLKLAIKQCWNLGSTSSDALRTTVMVLVDMDRNGKPGTMRMVGWDGPGQGSADIAYQAARRAILICGKNGYDLPAEKYGQWRQIEITFNPDEMRQR
ncbi:energy transducer TonB [Aliiroseovarius sp. KMU-50]|uniref:Energy transducer TonB n=1 Tax=Aliiroseovarius salicola TaxID=3009082 RepID=A0ABT4W0G5_9RHOB|nr:energy transducer TonB [Aliiroseovarius sp. KMU-50]MDA5093998.1 energy transducer TonB [Aliiroseovarius sp. KMU-50]